MPAFTPQLCTLGNALQAEGISSHDILLQGERRLNRCVHLTRDGMAPRREVGARTIVGAPLAMTDVRGALRKHIPLLLVHVLAIDIEDFVGWAEVRRIERQITFEL